MHTFIHKYNLCTYVCVVGVCYKLTQVRKKHPYFYFIVLCSTLCNTCIVSMNQFRYFKLLLLQTLINSIIY